MATDDRSPKNPVALASVIAIALAALVVFAMNFFMRPRAEDNLTPVGSQGSRTEAPVNAPQGASNPGNSAM